MRLFAFPRTPGAYADGMELRDWFATFAPEADMAYVKDQIERDRIANPHCDSYKPVRRSAMEIRTEWRYKWADAMIEARAKENLR